jgi:hypothetical protein
MDWMMVRQRHDAQSETQAGRALRQRRENQIRLGAMRIAGHEMMLDQPHAVESEPVRKLDLRHAVGEYFRFAAAASRRHGKLVEKVEKQGEPSVVCLQAMAEPLYCRRSAISGSALAS